MYEFDFFHEPKNLPHMPDDFTQTFFTWLKGQGLKFSDISTPLEVVEGTIKNWPSAGIPKSKRYACKALIKEHLTKKVTGMQEAKAVIPLQITQEQLRNWNRCSLEKGQLMEDWIAQGLDQLAAAEPLVADITTSIQEEEERASLVPHASELEEGGVSDDPDLVEKVVAEEFLGEKDQDASLSS